MTRFILFSLAACATAVLGSPLEQRDAISDQTVALHNQARAQYGARTVQWNPSLYQVTLQYAQTCKPAPRDPSDPRFGQNYYATPNPQGPGIQDAMTAWMAEASKYNYNNPVYSPATGDFTQVVWKATTQVACAVVNCPPGTVLAEQPARYTVCRYGPPGNVAGQFPPNVGRHV